MEQLLKDIYEIIKDYREDEGKMSINHIEEWINQFPNEDRIFILSELRPILSKRYFSKLKINKGLEDLIQSISTELSFSTPAEFLKDCSFIDHQPDGKSQKDILSLIKNISQNKFGFDLSNHNPTNPRFFIYIDDFLCTGDTLFKGLAKIEGEEKKGWLFQKINGQTNLEFIKTNNAKIIILYFVIHNQNFVNVQWRLKKQLDENISDYFKVYYQFNLIENDFKKADSKLDFLFPTKDNQPQNIIDYFNSLNVSSDVGVFRDPNYPREETFFSSKENRIRFENIMLQQGMRLFELAGRNRSVRMRPLGYGLTSHKNFGFGTLCFSYRNVPFNTPLVFWYPYHGWKALFERKFINYGDRNNLNLQAVQKLLESDYGDDSNTPLDLPY